MTQANFYIDINEYLNNIDLDNFKIIGCTKYDKNIDWVKEKHSHEYMELIYFLDGTVNIDVPGKLLHLASYNLVVYPEGALHQELPDYGAPQRIISLAVEVSNVTTLATSFKILDSTGVLRWLFEQIHYEYCMKKELYCDVIKYYFASLLLQMQRNFLLNNVEDKDILSISLQYIHDYYFTDINVQKLASICHVSESYLSRLFTKKAGFSPIHYLNLYRIEIGKRMLQEDSLSIKEIAVQLGFSDALYFSRLFKKHTKMSPSEYRKSETSFNGS